LAKVKAQSSSLVIYCSFENLGEEIKKNPRVLEGATLNNHN